MSDPTLVAVGWATVDIERAAGAWPAGDLRHLRDDPDLGARVVAIHGVAGLVLIEPITEGRLAAALARFGEGPVAVYVRPPSPTATLRSTLGRAAREGPFGPQALVGRPGSFGPFVIAVLDATTTDTIGS